jgi:FAS-associated factor 2
MANAAADIDISQLTPGQQEALQQYTDVTSQDIKDALALLQRCQWNVQVRSLWRLSLLRSPANIAFSQIAITKFFDGDVADPVADAIAAQSPNAGPRSTVRHENLHESLLNESFRAVRPIAPHVQRTEPAPRVVPQPQTTWQPPFLLAVLFTPLRLGYRVAATLIRSFFWIFTFLPTSIRPRALAAGGGGGARSWARGRSSNGRKMLMPRDTAARFKREFEEQYGAHTLPFFEGGAAQAQDLAKRDLKFLLIVLLSPEHDDTESFVRETLLSQEVVEFINDVSNNIILWGGNVQDSEAYQVSLEYNCTKFPFSALVCLTPKEGSTRMGIVKRLTGPMTPAAYIAGIRSAIAKYSPDLDGVRSERAANELTRSLRNEQDSAYERSLARDRERARQKKEAQARAQAEEKAALEKAAAEEALQASRSQWRRWRAARILAEPSASDKEAVRLALKMPESAGGERVIRRFHGKASLEELYAFVECYDLLGHGEASEQEAAKPYGYEHKFAFRIASLMPREVLDPSESAIIAEKVGRGGNLIVEELTPEEEASES